MKTGPAGTAGPGRRPTKGSTVMAKGQFLSGHQQGIVKRYYDNQGSISVQKLGELVSDLAVCTDAKKLGELWQRVHKALQKLKTDQLAASRIVAERNLEALAKLVGELSTAKPVQGVGQGPSSRPAASAPVPAAARPPALQPGPTTPAAATTASSSAAAEITPEVLAKAFAAFKKRLKLTQLEQDSKLGRSPLSAGKSRVTAITPPREFPRAVWDELFAQGKVRPVGGGMFELVWTPDKK